MKSEEREKNILNVILKEYEITRNELRAIHGTHEKTMFWLSSGLLAATAACFKQEFNIGFAFIPLVIISYYAHRMYRFTLHINMLSRWNMRNEELVDLLLNTKGLLDWERRFVRRGLKTASWKSILSAHYFAEGLMFLPSLVVFGICLLFAPAPAAQKLQISPCILNPVIWYGYPVLALSVFIRFAFAVRKMKLDHEKGQSVRDAYQSITGGSSKLIDKNSE